jgi:peptidoglycan L-alanyl-D-glutamate endopeptidase CwlK
MINSRKISDLHPYVQKLCQKHIDACAKYGVRVTVTSTLRDQEYQTSLYAQGRTKPGSVVTQVKLIGAHGFGLAYDLAPLSKDGNTILWNDNAKWAIIGNEGKKLGLKWGGDWKTIVDKPHFEMTDGLTYADLRVGKRPSWWKSPMTIEQALDFISSKTGIDKVLWLANSKQMKYLDVCFIKIAEAWKGDK